eukprot:scaffold449_cov184-Amphora_coffeaeformis.AAC.7
MSSATTTTNNNSNSNSNKWMGMWIAACGGCCCTVVAVAIAWKSRGRRRNDHLHRRGLTKNDTKKNQKDPPQRQQQQQQQQRRHRRLTLYDTMMRRQSSSTSPSSQQQQQQQYPHGSLLLEPIGVVRSVYALCVGTPRQGLLAPATRGRIELLTLPADAVKGLEEFSHIWIQFVFHLNTQSKSLSSSSSSSSSCNNNNNNNKTNKQITTIAPPALGGQRRVGVLATRSPHRPNPIGMTLARLDRITTEKRIPTSSSSSSSPNYRGGKKPKQVTCLYISGIDLVDGTPVLDIKPYVAVYDTVASPLPPSPPPPQQQEQPDDTATEDDSTNGDYRVPTWVAQGLQTRRQVEFTPLALEQLADILHGQNTTPNKQQQRRRLEFYDPNELGVVQAAIHQVLSVDVRSAWQTRKARQGAFKAERSHRIRQQQQRDEETTRPNLTTRTSTSSTNSTTTSDNGDNSMNNNHVCTQQLDNLLIHYTVAQAGTTTRIESDASGAEDVVQVTAIEYLPIMREQ